ncbi:MAG: zf-HC2 domain-containing protein [Acidobacteriota bacterium]
MTCIEFEILLADYLDGTLAAGGRATVEAHRNECAACAELALDAAGAVAFIERAATVDPPPALVNRILFEVTSGASRSVIKPSWMERLLGRRAGFILQPRFAMGMAMAVISLAMVGRFWGAAESGVERSWDRAVKGYENLQLVYEVQTQLEEWAQQRGPANDIEDGAQSGSQSGANPARSK